MSTNVEGQHVSPNDVKPLVVGSTAVNDLIHWCVSNAFNIEGQDGVKYVAIDYEEMQVHLKYFIN